MIRIFILTLFIAISALDGHTQKLKNFKWPDKPTLSPVNEKYKDEPAYIISEKRLYSLIADDKGIYVYNSVSRKIKLQTAEGLQLYGRAVLPRLAGQNLIRVDARTIKKDGTIIDFDVKDIKQLSSAGNDDIFKSEEYVLFAIPGAEIGDEIEVFAGYGGYGLPTGDDIFFNSYLPSEQTEITIKHSKHIEMFLKLYNNISSPERSIVNTERFYKWVSKDVISLGNQPGAIPSMELPYVRYALRAVVDTRTFNKIGIVENTWGSVLDYYGSYYLIPGINKNNQPKLEAFFENIWNKNNDTTRLSKIRSVHDFLNENIEIDFTEQKDPVSDLSTLVENKKIDPGNLYKIYHYLLYKTGGPYNFNMSRNNEDGNIDVTFVAIQQINSFSFSFKDEQNKVHHLFPKSETFTLELDEIPPGLQGTDFISIELDFIKDILQGYYPENNVDENIRIRQFEAKMDLKSGSAVFNGTELMQGVFSTYARKFYLDSEKNNSLDKDFIAVMKERNDKINVDSIKIDSFDKNFPFQFKLKYQYHIENSADEISEKLYSISIDNWYTHYVLMFDSTQRFMDYYFPHIGKEIFKYYLTFTNDVELVNSKDINKHIYHPSCIYSLELTQVNKRTILVESIFEIKKFHVPLKETSRLMDLFLQMHDAANGEVLIKTN